MEGNKSDKNNAIAISNTQEPRDLTPDVLTRIELLADRIADSEAAKPFRKVDEDGKYIMNEDGTFKVSKGDIISNMTIGYELGLSHMGSLMLGTTLNANSFFSVLRGRALGLDPITSISKIYNISTKNGNVLSLAVDIISATILKSGTKMTYVRDAQTLPTYYTIEGKYIGHKYQIFENNVLGSDYYLVKSLESLNDDTTLQSTKAAMAEGKIIIYVKGTTKVTSLRLVRKLNNGETIDNTFHYSLQQATDAGLYQGYHTVLIEKGKPKVMEGRGNWNNHPETMLRNRVTSIGGRIVVADLLQGSYSHEEAAEIVEVEVQDLQNYTVEDIKKDE